VSQPIQILLVEDHADSAQWLQVFLRKHGFTVRVADTGERARKEIQSWAPDVVLMDLVLPDVDGLDLLRDLRQQHGHAQVIIITGHGSIARAVEAMKAGASNFVEKPVDTRLLLGVLQRAVEHVSIAQQNRRLLQRVHDEPSRCGAIVTRNDRMRRVLDVVRSVAPTDASVLINGENGTGKELVADALHQLSARARGPFVKINCAAIPSELIESELFGYKRGAFTGAVNDKVGLFEQASGGTLLLDEIGEMPYQLQAKLLRVLQERHARPLGGHRTVELNFRLLTSTNADLQQAISQGRFREDLYFRINTISITIPPLRERPEDIPVLAEHFREKFATTYGKPVNAIRQDAHHALLRHSWRGNVRELEHAIERAVIVCQKPEIGASDLPETVTSQRNDPRDVSLDLGVATLAEVERAAIVRTLEHTKGNKRAAAAILGVYRPVLYSKLRKYGIGEIERRAR
jgi:DNA-binding NtrC family response regulator